ncbi:proline-rich proteoglycan 2-like [Theropithecus gelada]|uniref:proline-rich proteoglycan 2-like n=1 Tax=Theropithecus gelada TaxID=9565 RepID=UPI000DC15FEE|nr:proline-rich proteoglycan 2-like [Theropithecus gelada]
MHRPRPPRSLSSAARRRGDPAAAREGTAALPDLHSPQSSPHSPPPQHQPRGGAKLGLPPFSPPAPGPEQWGSPRRGRRRGEAWGASLCAPRLNGTRQGRRLGPSGRPPRGEGQLRPATPAFYPSGGPSAAPREPAKEQQAVPFFRTTRSEACRTARPGGRRAAGGGRLPACAARRSRRLRARLGLPPASCRALGLVRHRGADRGDILVQHLFITEMISSGKRL